MYGLVVQGGAGTLLKENMTAELESSYRGILTEALQCGYDILKSDGTSLDAVEAAIVIFEDSPLFNAGKGSNFTSSGVNELDASIMDGKNLEAGAVAAVKHIKNPIGLARMVLEKSQHVLLAGEGAEIFASGHGVETVSPDYFFTERRWNEMKRLKDKGMEETALSEDLVHPETGDDTTENKFGTVGAVALDQAGNLAAGTSTGGLTNKRFGRVGDSSILGAGTYANNSTCAVSGTGQGEFFMRALVAYDISALMEYCGMSLQEAADTVVMDKLKKLGGRGGVVAIDKDGNVAMPFNTPGMYRGRVSADGRITVKIYED